MRRASAAMQHVDKRLTWGGVRFGGAAPAAPPLRLSVPACVPAAVFNAHGPHHQSGDITARMVATVEEAVSAADANRKLSSILGGVHEGRSKVVTSHGRLVARVVPAAGPRKGEQ